MALIDILRGKATIVKQETVEEANSAPRIGGLFEDIFDYIKDVLHPEVDKVANKVSFTAQELTTAQQAQARANIKAAKRDVLVVEALTDLDRVDLENGEYSVTGSNDGLLKVAVQDDTVLQLFETSASTRRRRITIADQQTYPAWTISEGGGGVVADIADLPDEGGLRKTWSGKAAGNHNHDTAYAGFIKLESITGTPLTPQINTYWYDDLDKEIYLCTGITNEVPEVTAIAPKSGKIYKYIYTFYAWDGAELSEIGLNSKFANYALLNHNHDTVYLKPITLVSVTVAPVWVEGEKWYNNTNKKIYENVWLGSEESANLTDPELGKAYQFGGNVYKWNGVDLVELGSNSGLQALQNATLAASVVAATYALSNNKQTVITGVLPSGANSTFMLPTPVSGQVNESIVHFATNATAAPTLVYSGFTPLWLSGTAISMKISKNYTVVFEQIYNGTAWIVKASWGEY